MASRPLGAGGKGGTGGDGYTDPLGNDEAGDGGNGGDVTLVGTGAVADFYRDKNVTVVLPVGGQSSWYTDWKRPDNGKNYQWETFLAKELPPLLQQGWRATDARAAAGVSMGGTAAFTLAARNKGLYRFAGSYSGILSTSTPGTPESIGIAMRDAGGFNADAMYGPPTDPAWAQHDPLKLAEKLRLAFSAACAPAATSSRCTTRRSTARTPPRRSGARSTS